MATIGMDPSAVRALADEMDRVANQLHALIGAANGSVGRMHAGWLGADAEQLVTRWQRQSRPALETLAGHVHTMARTARTQAQQQDTASSAGGGSAAAFAGVGASGAGGMGRSDIVTPSLWAGMSSTAIGAYKLWANGKSWDVSGGKHAVWWNPEAHGSTRLGAVPVSGDASVAVTGDATYSAHAGINRHGVEASGTAAVGVGVLAAANGMIGNKHISATGHAEAGAEAGARADGKVHLGQDGLTAKAGVKAFAGAHADASAHGQVGGVGGSAGAHAYAGVGVNADAEAKITMQKVHVGVDVGASLGFGGGVSFSVDVEPDKVLDEISRIPHIPFHF